MKSSIDIDSATIKMLKYLYKYRRNGCAAELFLNKFGLESSAFILEFCKLGYVSFTSEGHSVNEHVFQDYINNRIEKRLPLIDKSNKIYCMPKGNKIVESERKEFFGFILPIIISVISVVLSVFTFAYTVVDDSTVKVEIVSEQK